MKLSVQTQRPVLREQPLATSLHILAVLLRLRRHAGKAHVLAKLIDKLRLVVLEITENFFHARRIKLNLAREASEEFVAAR